MKPPSYLSTFGRKIGWNWLSNIDARGSDSFILFLNGILLCGILAGILGMILVPFIFTWLLPVFIGFVPTVFLLGLSFLAAYCLEARDWHDSPDNRSRGFVVINTWASFTFSALLVLLAVPVIGLMVSGGWIPVAAAAVALPLCQIIAAFVPPAVLLLGGLIEEKLTGSHSRINAGFLGILYITPIVSAVAGAVLGGILGGILAIFTSITRCMGGGAQLPANQDEPESSFPELQLEPEPEPEPGPELQPEPEPGPGPELQPEPGPGSGPEIQPESRSAQPIVSGCSFFSVTPVVPALEHVVAGHGKQCDPGKAPPSDLSCCP